MSDFIVRNEGSVVVFQPRNTRAKNFTDTDLNIQPWQRWANNAFVVQHSIVDALISSLQDEGFIVESE